MRVLAYTILLVAFAAGAASAATTHIVQPGETLWVIASAHRISVGTIARANNLRNADVLQPGQRLIIPASSPRRAAGQSAAAPSYATYKIKSGDTLWALAQRFGMSVERLAALNGIAPETTLRLGQVLKVAAGPATVPRASAAPSREYVPYRVQPGDSLWTLARRFDMPVRELAAANRIGEADTLQIGQVLKVKALLIPARRSAGRTPAAPLRRIVASPYRGAAWANSLTGLARRFIGTRYRWGATGPSAFDCSGFLQYVFARTGVSLPRTTYAMYQAGRPVPEGELLPGDMIFFTTYRPGPSHAGIYLGDGQFIHSSSGYGSVTITPLSKDYYRKRYLGARRF